MIEIKHPAAIASLAAFDNETEAFLTAEEVDIVPPTILYHYTSAAGLLGMLESGKLWLSDVRHLNDPSEMIHGVTVATRELLAAVEKVPEPDRKPLKFFAEVFDQLSSHVLDRQHYHVFCWTTEGDDLTRWRFYGDNCNGFCVGFDGASVTKRFLDEHLDPVGRMAFPIDYSDEPIKESATKLISYVLPRLLWFRNATPQPDPEDIRASYREFSAALMSMFMILSQSHKHGGFRDEGEFRFLEITRWQRMDSRLKKRLRRLSFIPYSEFLWARAGEASPLISITSGPATNKAEAEAFMKECLERFKVEFSLTSIDDVNLSHSDKPYRP